MAVKAWSEREQRAIVDAATCAVLLYRETEQVERVEGALWYPERWAFCQRLWPEHPERVAAVVAVFSAKTTWQVNAAYVVRAVSAWHAGQPCPALGFTAMRDKAWRALAGEDPEGILPPRTSPKTNDFYHSIVGATDRPVIDRWMARAMGLTLPQNQGIPVRLYRLLSEALTLAATQLGVEPRYLQATLWIHKGGDGE